MTRPNAFQTWLKPKTSDQQNELRNLVLTAQTSKVAYQAVKKRGFRGSYDSILNFRNANKQGTAEAIAASVVAFERKLESTQQSANNPLEGALLLSVEMQGLCSKLVGLLASYNWTEGGDPLSVRDALKLAAVVPSLARASTGSLVELFNLRKELDYEIIADSLLEELLTEARLVLAETPEHLPIVEGIVECTKSRLEMKPERYLSLLARANQTESL
jgi:hypothetical protein